MLAKVESGSVLGMDAFKVDVEIDVSQGLPSFTIVGLADTAIKESRERVRASISNSEFEFPLKRITVNLAPADTRKEGPTFDLPIAISILKATNQFQSQRITDYLIAGELSLNGNTRRIDGALVLTLWAKKIGKKAIILPQENCQEAALVEDIDIIPVSSLRETVEFLSEKISISPYTQNPHPFFTYSQEYETDFSEVKGQEQAKRVLEVAAAGGHNVLMIGSPGSGKTMLAQRLPTIMPNMRLEEAIEVTKIYSVAGLLSTNSSSLISKRPFRAPHHTISDAGLVGGGTYPKPGEISLSHYGVLFLDEFPEFNRSVLEVLRQPLEEGYVTISRATTTTTYPAQFVLISAMNPCRCGWFGDNYKECICTPHQIQQYRRKISGPLLDRIDIHIDIPRLTKNELTQTACGESSQKIKTRVEKAQEKQYQRFKEHKITCNAQMKPRHLNKFCLPSKTAKNFLEKAIDQLSLTGRAYDRILKVARTIADLAGRNNIEIEDIAEAVQYRSLDREKF